MSATILLADDSLTIQKVVELTFADTEHEVITVSSGDELLGKLPEVRPDLVICDVIMPGTDGYEVCQSIKSSPATLHIPVLLLTGTFEPFDRDRALAAGADEIITKPFEARRLVEAVEKLLAKRAAPSTEEAAASAGMSFEGEVAPPVFAEGEGLDFTTTGFSEMEAAGAAPQAPPPEPAEGLEMSFSGMPGAEVAGAGEDLAEPEDDLSEPEEEPAEEAEESAPAEVWPEDEEAATELAAEEAEQASPDEADERPFVDVPADEPEPLATVDEPDLETGPEPSPVEEEPIEGITTEAATEPSPPPELAAAPPEAFEPAEEADAEAEPPAAPAAAEPAREAAEPASAGRLSDEDVERIARRVVELASGTLERIAWEVIPDMAELVVRERVRQLEAEIQREQDETPH